MPLTAAQMSGGMSLSLQKLVSGFPAINQGPDALNFELTGIDLTALHTGVFGRPGHDDHDHRPDRVHQLGHGVGHAVEGAGDGRELHGRDVRHHAGRLERAGRVVLPRRPGSTFGDGDSMVFLRNPQKTPVTVDATHKTVTFTISHSKQVTVAILGG